MDVSPFLLGGKKALFLEDKSLRTKQNRDSWSRVNPIKLNLS